MFLFQIMNLHNLSNYQVFTRDCWIFLNRNHGCYISREFYLRLLLFQNHLHFSFSKMQIFGIVVLRDCKQKQLTKYELEHRSHSRGRSHANLRPATLLTKRLRHKVVAYYHKRAPWQMLNQVHFFIYVNCTMPTILPKKILFCVNVQENLQGLASLLREKVQMIVQNVN